MDARPHEVLVTGGTGTLGRRVVDRLRAVGHETRVLSRSGRPGTVTGDLLTGEGVEAAVRGTNAIVHCASSPSNARRTDVGGTALLLQAAARAGVGHVVFVSIVGVDRNPFPYYRMKLAAERVVERSPVPWTILRATQFHDLILAMVSALGRAPLVAPIPKGFLFQPVEVGYEVFPLPGRRWVSTLGPFNEHLVVDYGALTLALAVLLAGAAIFLERRLVQVSLVAYLTFAVPHLVYHMIMLHHFPLSTDKVGLLLTLGLVVLLPSILLFLAGTRGVPSPRHPRSSGGSKP